MLVNSIESFQPASSAVSPVRSVDDSVPDRRKTAAAHASTPTPYAAYGAEGLDRGARPGGESPVPRGTWLDIMV